jgi:hypothetical protein
VETGGVLGLAVAWGDVARVVFLSPPPGAVPAGARLHGTVSERDGTRYTGYLTFDGSRVLANDPVGGRPGTGGRITFGELERLRWPEGGGPPRATLVDGEALTIPDAPSGNRSLRVMDAELGGIQLPLQRVAEVHFHPPAGALGYEAFGGGARLRGTVTTRSGERHHGFVRWDNDEEHDWEILNGSWRGATYTVELAHVRSIETDTPRRARVTLRDGRELELSGSNDVGPANKRLVIERDDGSFGWVDWVELVRFELEGP